MDSVLSRGRSEWTFMSQPPKTSPMVVPGNADAQAAPRPGEEGVPTGSAAGGDVPTIIGQPPAPAPAPESLVGQTFGDFELQKEVGRGGMGVVYKAWQKSLERPVALKLLLAEHASSPELYARFMAEARAAASLTHPNIVSVYQVGQCPSGPYFVMEYIDGPSLETLLKRTLPVAWSVSLLVTVAEAVQHAHERGIIHRDLKPGNIMLHLSRRPVVMDFGIAKVMGGKGTGFSTHPGTLIGTPAYMPPEQADDTPDKAPIGPSSDVYSLGAILYTLLTGKVPYDEGSALRTLMRVMSPAPPPAPRSLRPEVPTRLEQICMKCLEKDPGNRYQTAQALADELKRLRHNLSAKPISSSTLRTLPTVVLLSQGRKPIRLLNATTTVGRSSECDLVLRAADVSKQHCRIVLAPDGVSVEDLGSSNGTCVNGKPIDKASLRDGDKLDIGGHVFKVRIRDAGK
jgi:serine/threonine protein kinase